jgi:hypothetical protein
MEKDQIDINTIWETFKRKPKAAIDENIPSKIFKKNKNLPWMTKSLRRMMRRKVRLYRAARKSKQWTEYKKHQKECKKQFHKEEAQYVNNIITEGLEKNDRKPFWGYANSKKQENIGIAPLRHKGSMTNDSKEKANILSDQFKSVFKNSTSTTLEKSTIDRGYNIKTLKIGEQGVLKLLKDINPSKAMGRIKYRTSY